ncbi:PREDICTED: glutamine-rich protein 2 isoform X1 [Crocodylus porosus]|uniref:glutamine-rich protein 2 isoform X1 n=2 Tax=Crocodylus porosus TaxID=8502 RepID=UPI00093DF007|nr:PREDICTED: glutamine-rich protein 2 isoform X1 [Crocodylus porosus]
MAQISLSELADLSIGTPETGHVNFTALHTLLHAIIKHLNLQDLQTEMREEPAPPPGKGQPCEAAPLYADLEKKVAGVEAQVQDVAGQLEGLEKQLSALEKLPSGLDLLQRAKSGAQNGSAVADMWQMMQMKKRIEANENGVSKSMSLLQDLLNEVNGVKMAQAYTDNKIKKMKEKLGWLNPQEVDSQLQLCFMDQKNLNTDLKSLEQRLSLYPSPEELSNLVRWEILEDCLVTNKGKTPPSASQSVETIIGQTSLTRHPGLATDTHARKAPVTGVGASGSQVDSLGTAGGTSRMQTGSPGTQESTPAVQTKTAGSRGRPPSVLGGTSETRANTTPSVAAGTTGTRASTPSMPSGSSGTRASTPSAPPGTPDTRASTPTAPADISGAQPRASEAQAGGQGIQLGSPGAGPSSPGTQAGPTGVSPGVVGTQGGAPGMDVDEVSPSAWPSAPGTPMGAPGTEVGQPGTWHGSPATLTVTPGIQAGAVALPIQVDGQAGTPRARHWAPGLPTGVLVTQMAAQAGASSTLGTQVMPSRVGPSMPGTQVTPPEAEPSAPGTQVTPTGAWAGGPETQVMPSGAWASASGTQVTPPEAGPSVPGTQVAPPGAWAGMPETQMTLSVAWTGAPGTQVMPPGAWAGVPETQVTPPRALAGAPETHVTSPGAWPSASGTPVDMPVPQTAAPAGPPGDWTGAPSTLLAIPGTQAGPPVAQPSMSGPQAGSLAPPLGTSALQPMAPAASSSSATQLVVPSGSYVTQTPLAASPEQKDKLGATASFPRESSASSSTASRYSETMEALRQMGQLSNLYTALKEQVNQLEETKCTYSDLSKLKQLLLETARKNVPSLPAAVLDQLSSLKDMAEDMRSTKEKDEELLNRIQSTIINVQEDCEKLNTITGNLIEEHRQKQKDIDVLFQSLEKLEKEKADKEHLEMEIDVKADKISLASKVSRSQFDATLEQLNKMIQDLLNKMTGHEQDWHKVLDKLVVEMDSKLDRLELDPFREQLEERWKAIRKQLKEKSPQYEADEAAGIRKRLLAHFHCISCDRPLDMVVPGPTITRIPSVPMLPTHRSVRPYTVYELEQVRQQCRSDKMAEMECGYLSVPRHCGGSHTITYPYRRYTRLQQIAHCVPGHPGETTMLAVMKHGEVDILGLDGHIYKGRMETKLPSISGKNGPLKTKSKLSQSSFQKQSTVMDMDSFPARPQSAKLSSLSNTARSLKDRPVSSQGRLSQTSLIHPPSPTQSQEERDDFPMQEKETLEFQLTVPMSQQTDEQAAPFQ